MEHTDTNTENKKLRCPFQTKGEREKTIVEVHLNDNANERMALIIAGFKAFHEDRTRSALRFHLPASLLTHANSNETLPMPLLPYQAELLAGELDYRLHPYLPYQMKTKLILLPDVCSMTKHLSASLLSGVMKDHGFGIDDSSEIASWIQICMLNSLRDGVDNPILQLNHEWGTVVSINRHGTIFHLENQILGEDKHDCFAAVMTPFYPKEVARYSQDITCVFVRNADFSDVSKRDRQNIRLQSNEAYRKAGFVIHDVLKDQQHGGLWLPERIPQEV